MEIPPSSQLARICGELTGDGHIQISGGRHLISFYSKSIEVIHNFEGRFYSLFGIHGRIYEDTRRWKSYKLFFNSKLAVEILMGFEVPVGNKTNHTFSVPQWILSGNSDLKTAYLLGLFDSEGAVTYTNPQNRWRIEIEMYKAEFTNDKTVYMECIKTLLESLGIPCSPVRTGRKNTRKDGTASLAIKLEVKPSGFTNFYKKIGFSDPIKADRLREAINAAQRSGTRKPAGAWLLRRYLNTGLQSQAAKG